MTNSRAAYGGISLISLAGLSVAYYLQMYEEMAPCTYCVLVRYGLVFCLLLSFGLFLGICPRSARVARKLLLAPTLLILGSAAWLSYRVAFPSDSCGRDTVAFWLNSLPTAKAGDFFYISGLCGDQAAYFLGLHLAHWSFGLGFAILLLWRSARSA